MAKDPAVLFYTADFLTATMTWSNEQVGKYIRLLCLQHQQSRLSEQDMLNICSTHDERIFSKFKKDKNGYFNERLEREIVRRKNYSKSRSENRKGSGKICKTYDPHMVTEAITITENEIETIYRSFDHLSITVEDFKKLEQFWRKETIDGILDRIENYKDNKKYKSLYLTAKNWIKDEPKRPKML